MDRRVIIVLAVFAAVILFSTFEDTKPAVISAYTAPSIEAVGSSFNETTSVEEVSSTVDLAYNNGLEYHGDPCTVDCSGHEAGAEWAEQNGIDDPDDCSGNSDSFIEGCRTYAEEEVGDSEVDEDE